MEHRCTDRYNSDLKILISKHNLPTAIGRVKNGSRSGLFIETDFADIDCEHLLTLEFFMDAKDGNKLQRISMNAMVIHKSIKGLGAELEFQKDDHADLFYELLRGNSIEGHGTQLFAKVANS